MAHRYAFFLSRGKWPKNHACHTCDTRNCCNPDHLYDGTDNENMADAKRRGRTAKGKKLPQTKLSIEDATAIRTIYATGASSMKSVGKMFAVGHQTVFDIVHGKRWA